MKVLLVAPQSSDTVLGRIGGYCKDALISLNYDVKVFDFRKSQYARGHIGSILRKGIRKLLPFSPRKIPLVRHKEKNKMNVSLAAMAKEFKPDVLFVLMGETIGSETLKQIKRQGTIVVNWFHDSVLARKDFVENISSCYDYFFIIDSLEICELVNIKSRQVMSFPLACYPQVHKKIMLSESEKKTYGSQVCFVGTIKFQRKEILTQLVDFDLGIWGYWLEKIPKLKSCYRRKHIYGEEAVKIYNACDIVLDIPINYGLKHKSFYVTPRVFEVPACGGFLLTAQNSCLSNLYEVGKEIICYKDADDLTELINYYLKHPEKRKLIAQKGQDRTLRDHTYEKRLKQIFSVIEQNG